MTHQTKTEWGDGVPHIAVADAEFDDAGTFDDAKGALVAHVAYSAASGEPPYAGAQGATITLRTRKATWRRWSPSADFRINLDRLSSDGATSHVVVGRMRRGWLSPSWEVLVDSVTGHHAPNKYASLTRRG